ncbi:MAG: baseplate J/gp47 family protein [Pseudomonadota bacterium]|nr:baseplate J/gp47 family protein [Pseudomonadota bacterium]
MTTLSTKTFTDLVQQQVAAIQGASKALVDLTIGSILRVIVESNAAVVLWLQALILQLLSVTRAATSTGADLDSFVADYGFTPARIAATSASGQVTFARFTTTLQAVITVGVYVQSTDGSQKYIVTLDTTNVNYSATLGGYVLAPGIASINVPVAALSTGSATNAVIGQISQISQGISGVDTVTNAAAFTNGADAETDPALRARFIAWVASLSKATKAAIGYAITSVQVGLTYTLTENYNYSNVWQPGYFTVIADDGTGYPSGTLLATIGNAIDAVRPIGSTFGVFAPVVVTANVNAIITTASGYTHSAVVALVYTDVTTYINGLGIGQTLSWTKLIQIIYEASPGITNVSGVTINAGTADLTATAQQVIKFGTVTIS